MTYESREHRAYSRTGFWPWLLLPMWIWKSYFTCWSLNFNFHKMKVILILKGLHRTTYFKWEKSNKVFTVTAINNKYLKISSTLVVVFSLLSTYMVPSCLPLTGWEDRISPSVSILRDVSRVTRLASAPPPNPFHRKGVPSLRGDNHHGMHLCWSNWVGRKSGFGCLGKKRGDWQSTLFSQRGHTLCTTLSGIHLIF